MIYECKIFSQEIIEPIINANGFVTGQREYYLVDFCGMRCPAFFDNIAIPTAGNVHSYSPGRFVDADDSMDKNDQYLAITGPAKIKPAFQRSA